MLGRDGYQMDASDEMVQVNLPGMTQVSSDQPDIQEYLMELAASHNLPDEEHVDLSSLNDEVYSEYEEEKREIFEYIEIPLKAAVVERSFLANSFEMERVAVYEEYKTKMDSLFPSHNAQYTY